MEIGNQHNLSSSPLSTITPRQVNTSTVSSTNRPAQTENSDDSAAQKQAEQQVSQQNSRVLQQLSARDREVRAHEAAHAAVGGQYTGAPSYTFQRGPDGRSYAIGGEVSIDASKVANDPEATATKADIVHRAALAPAQPSPQDLRVASRASQTASQARIEIAILRAEEADKALQERAESVDQLAEGDKNASVSNSGAEDNSLNGIKSTVNSATSNNDLAGIQSLESEQSRPVTVSLFA